MPPGKAPRCSALRGGLHDYRPACALKQVYPRHGRKCGRNGSCSSRASSGHGSRLALARHLASRAAVDSRQQG